MVSALHERLGLGGAALGAVQLGEAAEVGADIGVLGPQPCSHCSGRIGKCRDCSIMKPSAVRLAICLSTSVQNSKAADGLRALVVSVGLWHAAACVEPALKGDSHREYCGHAATLQVHALSEMSDICVPIMH